MMPVPEGFEPHTYMIGYLGATLHAILNCENPAEVADRARDGLRELLDSGLPIAADIKLMWEHSLSATNGHN